MTSLTTFYRALLRSSRLIVIFKQIVNFLTIILKLYKKKANDFVDRERIRETKSKTYIKQKDF